jgi:hypothetical protein
MKTIYLFVSEDTFVYGYHTELVEGDYVKPYEVDDNFHEFFLENLGKLYFKNNKLVIGLDKEEIQRKIVDLKIKLGDSDWKVVVNAELIQAGLPPKYPNLHEERQAWRDDINDLEAEILFLGLE